MNMARGGGGGGGGGAGGSLYRAVVGHGSDGVGLLILLLAFLDEKRGGH